MTIERTKELIIELIKNRERSLRELKNLGLLLEQCTVDDEQLIALISFRVRFVKQWEFD